MGKKKLEKWDEEDKWSKRDRELLLDWNERTEWKNFWKMKMRRDRKGMEIRKKKGEKNVYNTIIPGWNKEKLSLRKKKGKTIRNKGMKYEGKKK